MKRRQGAPWMTADAYAHSLSGLTVNLLVHQLDAALDFHEQVPMVKTIYRCPLYTSASADQPYLIDAVRSRALAK